MLSHRKLSASGKWGRWMPKIFLGLVSLLFGVYGETCDPVDPCYKYKQEIVALMEKLIDITIDISRLHAHEKYMDSKNDSIDMYLDFARDFIAEGKVKEELFTKDTTDSLSAGQIIKSKCRSFRRAKDYYEQVMELKPDRKTYGSEMAEIKETLDSANCEE
jgi:hypothetical protein